MSESVDNVICPKCETVLRPSFTTCREGHLICDNCRQHQDASTGESIADTNCGKVEFSMPILNKQFKNSVDFCQYDCGYRSTLILLAHHEIECTKRQKLVKCIIPNCEWSRSIGKLILHLNEAHPGLLLDISDQKQEIIIGFDKPVRLIVEMNKFVPNYDIYWLRLLENAGSRYIIIVYEGNTGINTKSVDMFKEYSIFSRNNQTHLIKCEVIVDDVDILSNIFVYNKGNGITPLGGDSFTLLPERAETSTIPESFRVDFECYVCKEMLSAPIRICCQGHSMCGMCSEKIEKCPNCQGNMLKEARNYALEQLASHLNVNCIYENAGCVVVGSKDLMSLHAKNCDFQPSECVSDTCKWKGTYNGVVRHWKEEHFERLKVNGSPHTSNVWYWYVYHVSDNNFLYKCSGDENHFYISVHHLTYRTETDFHFDLRVSNPTTDESISFSRCCLASTWMNTRKIEYLMNARNVCLIPRSWLQDVMLNSSRDFTVTVNIYKKNIYV